MERSPDFVFQVSSNFPTTSRVVGSSKTQMTSILGFITYSKNKSDFREQKLVWVYSILGVLGGYSYGYA